MADLVQIYEGNFEREVLQSMLPVLVDFGAVWCGPCKMLDPIVRQLAQEWDGRVKVGKLDVDESPNLAAEYGIMGVPALVLFVKGQPVERVQGYQPKDRLVKKLGPHIEKVK